MGRSRLTDLRIRRTRKTLRDALIELIREKGYRATTIADISRRAMVNRSTFYDHFESKDDLMNQGIADVFAELTDRVPPPPSDTGQLDLSRPLPVVVMLFEHVRENERFYRAMLTEGAPAIFARRFQETMTVLVRARTEGIAERLEPVVPIDIAMQTVTATELAVIRWWLENDMELSPEEMAVYLAKLMSFGVLRCLGLPVPDSRS